MAFTSARCVCIAQERRKVVLVSILSNGGACGVFQIQQRMAMKRAFDKGMWGGDRHYPRAEAKSGARRAPDLPTGYT